MKKLLLLLFLFPCYAFAQIIPPVNDSTAIGTPGAAFTPTFRVVTYGGKTLVQYRIGTSAKWMTLSTTQYNRNYAAKTDAILNQQDTAQNASFWIKYSAEIDNGVFGHFPFTLNYSAFAINNNGLTLEGKNYFQVADGFNYHNYGSTSGINLGADNILKDVNGVPYLKTGGAPTSAASIHNQDTTTQAAKFKINGVGQASQFIAGDPDAGVYTSVGTGAVEMSNPDGEVLLSTGGLTISNTNPGHVGGFSITVDHDKIGMDNTIDGAKPFEVDWLQSTHAPSAPNDAVRLQDLSNTSISTSFANRDTASKYYQYFINRQLQVDTTLQYERFGYSWAAGFNAPSTITQGTQIFKNTLGLGTLFNNASGGTGALYNVKRAYQQSPIVNNPRVTTNEIGYTLIGQQGNTSQVMNMIYAGVNTFTANKFLGWAIAANDASISTTGVWSSFGTSADSAAMKAPYINPGTSAAMASFGAGATMTVPFTGSNVVIGLSQTDAQYLRIDSATLAVDGVTLARFNGNDKIKYAPQLAGGVIQNQNLNYYHQGAVVFLQNIGTGAHTLTITKGGNTTARLIVDYIGTLLPPSAASPLIFTEVPYFHPDALTTYRTLYGNSFGNGAVDTANAVIIKALSQYAAWPTAFAKLNSYYNRFTDSDPADRIHPNITGQLNYGRALLSTVTPTNRKLSAYINNVGYITNTITGTGANYYGSQYLNKDVSQGTGTNRYLILTKVSLGGSLVGNITGKRTKASSAGTNSANIYVNIRQNATTSTAYWESDAGTNATQPVLVTVTGDFDGTGVDTWYAIDAITTGSSSSLEKAIFVGQAEATGVPFTWVPAASVTALGTFQSNGAKNFGGRLSIGTTGLINANGLTASSALGTDASKNFVSVTNTGTGNNVLATSPTLVTPTLGAATATSINKVTITAPATSAILTLVNGSTLATAGAFSTTLTATGTTNITLPTTGTLQTLNGVETVTNKTLTTPKLTGYTVATLPAGTVGMMAYVTDALTPTFLVVVVGGGSVVTPVFYNGTAWVSY